MVALIVSYLIYMQELKLNAVNYFNSNNIKCSSSELSVAKINYFDIDMNFLYGINHDKKKLKKFFFNHDKIMNSLITIDYKKKEYILYFNKKLITFEELFKEYNQVIFKTRYEPIEFVVGDGGYYKYNSILIDNNLKIIARFDWTDCIGSGFKLSVNKVINKWLIKAFNKNRLMISKFNKQQLINFIYDNLIKNKINLHKKDIEVLGKKNNWKIKIFNYLNYSIKDGKIVRSINNSMKIDNFSKINHPNYNCGANRFFIFKQQLN